MAKSKSYMDMYRDRQRLIQGARGLQNRQRIPRPMDVSQFDGWTLQQIEERIRTLAHEELFVLDADDNVVAAYRGNSTSVAFPAAELRRQDATVTHGHPKGSAEFGGTFSFADVENMTNSSWSEHRATASGQGEMNYIMRRTARSNPTALRNRVARDQARLEGEMKTTYTDAYNRAISSGKTPSAARHEARQQAVGRLNRYWKDTMPQYGYEYVTRKEPYRYGR